MGTIINGIDVPLGIPIGAARRSIPGIYPFRSLGYNGDIDTTREDMWTPGGDYVFPTEAIQINIVSSSANDAAAGTGARTVDIHYLNTSFVEKNHTYTLNGVTAVTGPTDFYRLNHMEAMTAGSGAVPAGNISLTNTAGTVTYGYIAAGGNVALQAIYTVPSIAKVNGFTSPVTHAYITQWGAGANVAAAGKSVRAHLRATIDKHGNLSPGIFHFYSISMVSDGSVLQDFNIPVRCPSGTDIKISAIGAVADNICSGFFEGWLE